MGTIDLDTGPTCWDPTESKNMTPPSPRDPRHVKLLQGRIRIAYGSADVIVGKKDFSERYEVLGEMMEGERPVLAHISRDMLEDENFAEIDRILQEATP